ncbi:MAG: hypothetical protein HY288_03565 [Planctomycetia bacterium]|nr:hypothetical protein [Planctomycetia bacterium]
MSKGSKKMPSDKGYAWPILPSTPPSVPNGGVPTEDYRRGRNVVGGLAAIHV